MKLALVGVGTAGSRVVNRILAAEQSTGRDLSHGNTLLVNSTPPQFHTTEHVPEERRVTIGDVYWEVDSEEIGADPDLGAKVAVEERNDLIRAFDLLEFHEVDGILVVAGLASGTGGGAGAVVIDQLKEICDEPVYAVSILPEESEGTQAALNAARSLQSFVSKADNVVTFDNDTWLEAERKKRRRVATNGTTSPSSPPTTGPSDGDSAAAATISNSSGDAASSAENGLSLEEELAGGSSDASDTEDSAPSGRGSEDSASDSGFVFGASPTESTADDGESPEATEAAASNATEAAPVQTDSEPAAHAVYEEVNGILAERLVTLFAAGELGRRAAPETRLDPSDVMRTLDTGGISAIGYASFDLDGPGLLTRWVRALQDRIPWVPDSEYDWLPDTEGAPTDAAKINRLVRRAVESRLTLPCERSSADRALILLSGPSGALSRKGFESGRYWLEREADIVDVMAGDEPHDRASELTAVVLFSNVTDVPRIERMQETAVDADPLPSAERSNYGTANPP